MSFEAKIKELGLEIPEAAAPLFNYIPTVQTGNLLFVAGQVSKHPNGDILKGKLGRDVTVEQGALAARSCVLHGLAHVRRALGSLDNVSRVVKVVGFVATHEGFTDQPKVINGASDLLVEIFGDRGKHARSAVGVYELPLGCAVEVEFIFEVKTEAK